MNIIYFVFEVKRNLLKQLLMKQNLCLVALIIVKNETKDTSHK